ncbi:MAG: hypothetical protein C0509_03410, partial [Acinetobacter sp.]|nr:hypothetical protein [Acinetobacter sp.]
AKLDAWRAKLSKEYEHYTQVMAEWAALKEAWYAEKKQSMLQKWEETSFKTRFQELEFRMKMQSKRLHLLTQQVTA